MLSFELDKNYWDPCETWKECSELCTLVGTGVHFVYTQNWMNLGILQENVPEIEELFKKNRFYHTVNQIIICIVHICSHIVIMWPFPKCTFTGCHVTCSSQCNAFWVMSSWLDPPPFSLALERDTCLEKTSVLFHMLQHAVENSTQVSGTIQTAKGIVKYK